MASASSSLSPDASFSIRIVNNQYYYIVLKDDIEFGIEDLIQVVEEARKLGARKLPVLTICPDTTSTNADLLSYLSKNENNPYSAADAFVISSTSHSILANFYMKVNKPQRPTKFFSKEVDALEWLKQFFK